MYCIYFPCRVAASGEAETEPFLLYSVPDLSSINNMIPTRCMYGIKEVKSSGTEARSSVRAMASIYRYRDVQCLSGDVRARL